MCFHLTAGEEGQKVSNSTVLKLSGNIDSKEANNGSDTGCLCCDIRQLLGTFWCRCRKFFKRSPPKKDGVSISVTQRSYFTNISLKRICCQNKTDIVDDGVNVPIRQTSCLDCLKSLNCFSPKRNIVTDDDSVPVPMSKARIIFVQPGPSTKVFTEETRAKFRSSKSEKSKETDEERPPWRY